MTLAIATRRLLLTPNTGAAANALRLNGAVLRLNGQPILMGAS